MMDILFIVLLIYLVLINITGFVLMGADKAKARNNAWRIPEKTFFIVSLAGGSAGTLAGMYVFHHKTKHWYFAVFIPLILAVQIIAVILYMAGVF